MRAGPLLFEINMINMNLLGYPKSDYLLEAPLKSLHDHSVTWLNELNFWKDEMVFFYHLLYHQKFSKPFPSAEMAEIEKEIVELNVERLDRLRSGVARHEQNLASVYRTASMAEEQIYREAHRNLLNDIDALYEDIRKFKKKIFSFVEN